MSNSNMQISKKKLDEAELRKELNKNLLYHRQYELKIPFYITLLTEESAWMILIVFLILKYVFTFHLIKFFGITLFLSFLVYKYMSPRYTELEKVWLIAFFIKLMDGFKGYVFRNRKKS